MSVRNEIEHYIQDSEQGSYFCRGSLEHFSDFIGAELTNIFVVITL